MKKLLLILLCLPFIGFGQVGKCISGDCVNGYGTYKWKGANKGEKYVGEWKNDMRNGQGTNISGKGPNKGDKYVGEYKDDKKHGQGTYTWVSGDKFVGEWKNSDYVRGTYTWTSGSKYVGEWKQNMKHGQGTYIFGTGPNKGDKYVGEYKDDKKHGQGTYTWAHARSENEVAEAYTGEWKDGKRHGQGTQTYFKGPDKGEYTGEWKDDKKHGQGTHIFSYGVIKNGVWKHGNFIASKNPDTVDEKNKKENISAAKEELKQTSNKYSLVDKNIPRNSKVDNRYALIFGNEDYQSKQRGISEEQNVEYAINDATVFKKYCLNALGVKEDNMYFFTDATAIEMNRTKDLVSKILKRLGDKAELIVYYAGHGYPDETTKTPYLIPVDVPASDLSYAIKLDDFYKDLSATGAKSITIFLDACFTGGGRSSGLLASRGVKVKPKEGVLDGNLIVFSASSEEQSALPYHKEGHGMFTYHLLKKLQESEGKVSMGELADYIKSKVSIQSLKTNEKEQDPVINTSLKVVNDWRNWKF